MSAKITGLEIENFRGIEHLQLSFLDPTGSPTDLVVLAGPNGCGKTSVLEAILIATKHSELARGKTDRQASRFGTPNYLLDVQIRDPLLKQKVQIRNHSNLSVGYFSSWREPNLPGALGITAGKKGKRPSQSEVNRLWLLKQYLVNAQANELFTANAAHQKSFPGISDSPFQTGMQKLHRFWNRFYPGQHFSVEPLDRTPDSGFDLFLNQSDGGRISVDDLSSGQLELLQFGAEFIVRDTPLDILLIDEPELHLDPAWHVQIVRAIRDLAPRTQLIVGTHSVEIYDAAMSFERHFLVPDDDPRAKFWKREAVATGEAG